MEDPPAAGSETATDDAAGAPSVVVLGAVSTPAGTFGAALTPRGLARLTVPSEPFAVCETWAHRRLPGVRLVRDPRSLAQLAEQLTAYLEGELRAFTVPVDLRGTPFQLDVWRALQRIGYGEVRSYAALAAEIGRPRAVRAVGAANGANPVPIIVPCHRVIGSSGALTGYAGGLGLKGQLLRLEGVLSSEAPAVQPVLLS